MEENNQQIQDVNENQKASENNQQQEIQPKENFKILSFVKNYVKKIKYQKQVSQEIQKIDQQMDLLRDEYKQAEKEEYFIYEVEQDESSINGIALQFNMNPQIIRQINYFSIDQQLYKGQKIKLPSESFVVRYSNSKTQSETLETNMKINEQPTQQNLEQMIQNVYKYEILYCTIEHEIKGVLTINNELLMFDPDIETFQKQKDLKGLRIVEFQACIQLEDINSVNVREVESEHIDCYQMTITFQQKAMVSRLKRNRQPTTRIVTIIFRAHGQQAEHTLMQIQQSLSQHITTPPPPPPINQQQKQQKQQEVIQSEQDRVNDELWKEKEKLYLSILLKPSDILNKEQLLSLAQELPRFLHFKKWDLCYSLVKNGINYNTLLRMSKPLGHNILLVQDHNGTAIGAYLSEGIKLFKDTFYGTGETFLFHFTHHNQVTTYRWSYKNSYFIYSDNNGFGIGVGEDYGIYVDQELNTCFTNATTTFSSPPLLDTPKFQIKNLEIWALPEDLKKLR